MGYDMLETTERKNGKMYDDSDYSCGEENETDDKN